MLDSRCLRRAAVFFFLCLFFFVSSFEGTVPIQCPCELQGPVALIASLIFSLDRLDLAGWVRACGMLLIHLLRNDVPIAYGSVA